MINFAIKLKFVKFIFIGITVFSILTGVLFLKPAQIETIEEVSAGLFHSIAQQIQVGIESQKEKSEIGNIILNFHYIASEGEIKEWELMASQAIVYDKSKLVIADKATIQMFSADGKTTHIEGGQAHYKMGSRDVELHKNVKVIFPDGFWLQTENAHYEGMKELITSNDSFYSEAQPHKNELLNMWGVGFIANKIKPEVYVLNQAHVRLRRFADDEITDVYSDLAQIDRFAKIVHFNMAQPDKFVESDQGTMHVRSRKQEALYDSEAGDIKYLTATDDVLIKETDPKKSKTGLKYATGQRADFLEKESKILLSGFPSAYQDQDTITGDLITIYRKKNVIEVTQANTYHEPDNGKKN